MSEATEIWKRLFFLLHNNGQPDNDLPSIWTRFKAGHLQKSDLKTAIADISDTLRDDVRKRLNTLFSEEKTTNASLLYAMQTEPLLKDDFWCLLFRAIRDSECTPIDDNTSISLVEAGQTKQMTMTELEERFGSENKDNLKSQTSVPDQMIHEDLIDAYLSTDSIECSLKQAYEIKLSEALEALATENPRWKKEEVEKQAVAQASPCEKAVIKFLIKNCPGKAGSEIFKCGQGSSEAGGHEG